MSACVTANCVQGMFGHVLLYLLAALHRRYDCYFVTWLSISGLVALAQRGKRPCACLIDTLWKRYWHVSACLIETYSWKRCWHVSLWPNVGRGLVHVCLPISDLVAVAQHGKSSPEKKFDTQIVIVFHPKCEALSVSLDLFN
jgi:hypothetical protein